MTFQLQTPKIAFGDIQLEVESWKLRKKWDYWKLEVETNVFLEVGS